MQVKCILEDLEKKLGIKPTVWIPKLNFISRLKNPFKIGLLMGPESPEVYPLSQELP